MNFRSLGRSALARLTPQPFYVFVNGLIAARDIASRRRWAPEIEHLPLFVKPGDTVADIGAGHGLFTYHLSHLVGASGHVHAFEPIPLNLQILRHTIKRHGLGNVTVHAAGCGENKQRAQFGVPLENGIPSMGGSRQGGGGISFDCDIVRLDDVLAGPVHFLKIDVEGAELFALRGAARILRSFHPAILFEAGSHTAHFGYEQQCVFDYLSALGYRFLSGGFSGKPLEPRKSFLQPEDYFAVCDPLPRR